MEPSLICLLVLAFCGVSSISCEALTDEQLRVLFDTPVDIEEFVSNIFDLPPLQEMYVYEYLLDFIRNLNLEKNSKMAKFLNASLKLLQQKIDQFNEEQKLPKVSIKKFIQKRIDVQLKTESKEAVMNKASPPTENPASTTSVGEPTLEPQPSSVKNSNIGIDPKSGPKDSENPLLISEKMNTQPKLSAMNAAGSSGSKNSALKPKKSETENKRDATPRFEQTRSEPPKEPSSTAKENILAAPSSSSASNGNEKKPHPLLIQAPLPTNPLNFTLYVDNDQSSKNKKKHSSRKTKNTSTVHSSAPAQTSRDENPKLQSNSKQIQPNIPASLPTQSLISASNDNKLQSNGSNRVPLKSLQKSPEPVRNPISRENDTAPLPLTLPTGRKNAQPLPLRTKQQPQNIQTPVATNPSSHVKQSKLKPLQKHVKTPTLEENTKTMMNQLDDESFKKEQLQSKNVHVSDKSSKLRELYSKTETTGKLSYSI